VKLLNNSYCYYIFQQSKYEFGITFFFTFILLSQSRLLLLLASSSGAALTFLPFLPFLLPPPSPPSLPGFVSSPKACAAKSDKTGIAS